MGPADAPGPCLPGAPEAALGLGKAATAGLRPQPSAVEQKGVVVLSCRLRLS